MPKYGFEKDNEAVEAGITLHIEKVIDLDTSKIDKDNPVHGP